MTSAEQVEPDKPEGPLSRVVEGVKLPAVKAGQIVNEIADQAPLYGLSGAILAVGLVTGRKALARTGAQMLTGQIITAVARSVSERLLPDDKDAKQAVEEKPTTTEPVATGATRSNAARIATGALAGATALAAGGWLLSRLLRKTPDKEDAV
jgi:hypothetical protein